MTTPILEINGLRKHFRSQWIYSRIDAVKDVSLKVARGESFGFLGPNGAGKTTTIKCILGLIRKSGGEILIDGKPANGSSQHHLIGYLPEQPYFYDHLSVNETLDFFAQLYEIKNPHRRSLVKETLEHVGLYSKRKFPVRALSKGQQQRLGFAQAMINQPQLLLLDEPFSGLDPRGRYDIRQLILGLKERGTAVFLSSHILSDVEEICDRVAILSEGEVKTVFKLQEMASLFGEYFELRVLLDGENETLLEFFSKDALEPEFTSSAESIFDFKYSDYSVAQEALNRAMASKVKVVHFRQRMVRLEDVFLQITDGDKNGEADKKSKLEGTST